MVGDSKHFSVNTTQPETCGDPIRLFQMMLSKTPGGADRFFEKLTVAFAAAGVPQLVVIEPNPEREALFKQHKSIRVEPLRFGGLREPFARMRLQKSLNDFKPDAAMTWMSRASRRMPKGAFPKVARLGDYYPVKHYRRCDHLVANTPDILEYLKREGWPTERAHLIGNFCDPPVLDGAPEKVRAEIRRETAIPENVPVILALGRLHPKKAHDILLLAMASVPGVHLLLAGEGPIRSELETLSRELGINERVRFLGWRRDADRLFAAADICVMPSRFEPLGNVILEAWANRTPVIAARATGPEWLVEHEKTGLLFPVDDVDTLAAHLKRLLAEPEFHDTLVANGYERFERNFSRKAVVDQYLEFFERVIGETT